jgi:hypothetical protein
MTEPETQTLNGMDIKPFDQLIAEVREGYLNGISDILDEALAKFILPADRIALLQDAGLFLCFLVALKTAEVQTPAGALMDKKDPLRAWWQIGKRIDKEVPVMLLEYGREAAAAQVKGTGEEPADAEA